MGILTVCLVVSIFCMGVLSMLRLSRGYTWRWVYGVTLYLFVLLCAMMRTSYYQQQVKAEWSEERLMYTGIVSGLVEERARSWKIPIEVEGKQVLLYLAKDSLPQVWHCGDEVWFYTRIYPPLNRGNVDEFDYARYLECKGISGTAYAGDGYWQRGTQIHPRTWKQQALEVRACLIQMYRRWGLQGDELAVISALTLGDKSLLDEELKEAYSVAGASHILALSGLHIGIIYGLLALLIGFRSHTSRWDAVRGLVLVLALWAFAYLVGLSGSVVRATVMCTVVIVGRCLHRRGNSFNSLAMAAFAMLLYNPYYLFDVGFQMSFAAVAGILIFYPLLKQHVPTVAHPVGKYFIGVVLVSVAAQLGVAPLVAYYFDSFSVYFLVTNLVVVPLSFVLLCGAVALWMVSFWSWLHGWVLEGMQVLLSVLNTVVVHIGGWPYSSLSVDCTQTAVIAYYVCCIALLGYYYSRQSRFIEVVLVAVCCTLASYYYRLEDERRPRIHFYTDRLRGDVIACRGTNGRTFLIEKAMDEGGIIPFEGKYICVLQDDYWMDRTADKPFPLEVLYVRKEFRGDLEQVLKVFTARRVVVEAAVSTYRRKQMEEICLKHHLEFISLDDVGSWMLNF